MSTNVDQTSMDSQLTTAATLSATVTSGSKLTKFAVKSGFVIPKNKLSGSLVPIVRSSKKGASDAAAAEEGAKQVQRKTKWGPDLTQDTAVRRGRALAYQTRLEQITQQLNSGTLGTRDIDGWESVDQVINDSASKYNLEKQASRILELERREAIGEILQLDPSYKAPADYKPLQKEAKVLIPIKEYPSYDFIGLLFGPANDTHKRLEKETGAKIRVFGTKADTGEKVEVITSDGPNTHRAYEELHVHVSSDTHEKVDAAVALIELLLTPVSANPASVSPTTIAVDSGNATAPTEGTPIDAISQGTPQMAVESAPNVQQVTFQYDPVRWYPSNATPTSMLQSAGFTGQANPSAPSVSNLLNASPLPFSNMSTPSLFGPRPIMPSGLSSAPQSPSLFPSGPQPSQNFLRPYPPQARPVDHTSTPRNSFVPFSQSMHTQPNMTSPQFPANQFTPLGAHQIVRPGMFSFSQSDPRGSLPEQPTFSGVTSAGWSQPINMISRPPAIAVMHSHPPMASQPIGLSVNLPQSLPPPSAPQSSVAPVNRPINLPPFGSATHFHTGPSPSLGSNPTPLPIQSSSNSSIQSPQGPTPPAPTMLGGSATIPSPLQSGISRSASGNASTYNANQPPTFTAPRSQPPNTSDFTFQPNRPQFPVPQMPQNLNGQPLMSHPNQPVQLPTGSQNRPVNLASHNINPSPITQGFPRPQVVNQMIQQRPQAPFDLWESPIAQSGPVRHGMYSNPPAVLPNAGPRMPPRNPRTMQMQQNYPAPEFPPQRFLAPNHQLRGNVSFPPVGRPAFIPPRGQQQVYDPFSPTSVPLNPQMSSSRGKKEKQESDPEYEDLMASVGVK